MSDFMNSPKSTILARSTKNEFQILREEDLNEQVRLYKKSKSKSKSISSRRFTSAYLGRPQPQTMVSLADYLKPGTVLEDATDYRNEEEDQWSPLAYFNPMNAPVFYNGNNGVGITGFPQPNMCGAPVAPINLPQLPLHLPPPGLPQHPPWIYGVDFRSPTGLGFVDPAAVPPQFLPLLPPPNLPPPGMPMSPPGLSPSEMSVCETLYSPMTPQMSYAPDSMVSPDISLDECEFMEEYAIGYAPSQMLPLRPPKFSNLPMPNTDPLSTLKSQVPSASLKAGINSIPNSHSRNSSSSSGTGSTITAATTASTLSDSSYYSDSSATTSNRRDSCSSESSSSSTTPTQASSGASCWLSTEISGNSNSERSINDTKVCGPKRAPPGLPIPAHLSHLYQHCDNELPSRNSPCKYGPIKAPRLPLRWRRKPKTKIEYGLGSKSLIDPEDPCIKPLQEMRYLPLTPLSLLADHYQSRMKEDRGDIASKLDILSLETEESKSKNTRSQVVPVPLFQGMGFDYKITHPPRKGRTWTCCKCFQIHDFADGNVCPKDVHAFCAGCLAYVEDGREEEFGSWREGYFRGEEAATLISTPPTPPPIDASDITPAPEAVIAKILPRIMQKSKSVVDIRSLVQQITNTAGGLSDSIERSIEGSIQPSSLDIRHARETDYQICASPQSSSFDDQDELFSSAPASLAGSANTSPPSSETFVSVRKVKPLKHVLRSKLSDSDLSTTDIEDDGEVGDDSETGDQDLQFRFEDGFTVRRHLRSLSYGGEDDAGDGVAGLSCRCDTVSSTSMTPTFPVTDREGLGRLVKNLVERHRWRPCGST